MIQRRDAIPENVPDPLTRWLGRYFSFYILELGTGQAVSSPEKSEGDVLQSTHQSLNFRRPGRSRWLFVPKLSMNRINGDSMTCQKYS